ncbi:Protein of unknown function (DUF1075) [Nesidiocoris tenuis]|uniref:HIG1 domain-containing protein n=1 Tax=Nesidiocoris tenuis TaxID=355587 RepID=A0ABN7A6D4_9HEMI|nr:Protein of unknown function (DUF1075) [Nesidiocoris tenuis]
MIRNVLLWQPKKSLGQNMRTLLQNRLFSDKGVEPVRKPEGPPVSSQSIHTRLHFPNNFEKWLLVWTKKFKSVAEVPRSVPAETMTLAYNKGRIKTANYMMLATIVGCIVMVYSGKQAAERGESVHKMNLDWHKAIKEGKSG